MTYHCLVLQKRITALSLGLLIATVATSCQEERMLNENLASQKEQGWEIRYDSEHNYLEFETLEAFEKTSDLLDTLAPSEIAAWAREYGNFESMMTVFRKVQKAQSEYLDAVDSDVATGRLTIDAAREKGQFSPFLLKNKKIVLISDDGTYRPNIFTSGIGHVINEDGIVRVAGELSKFDFFTIKTLKSGGYNDLVNGTGSIEIEEVEHRFFDGVSKKFVRVEASDIKQGVQAKWRSEFSRGCQETVEYPPVIRDRRVIGEATMSTTTFQGNKRSRVNLVTIGFVKGVFGWSENIAGDDSMYIGNPYMTFRYLSDPNRELRRSGGGYSGPDNEPYLSWLFYAGEGIEVDDIEVDYANSSWAICSISYD